MMLHVPAPTPPTPEGSSALLTITSTSRFRHRAAKLKAREEHIRETWIKAMEARIVRDNLSKCQKVESVNHYERCKDLAERYADMLKENKVRGIRSFAIFNLHVDFGFQVT